jgi:hypothetical protein
MMQLLMFDKALSFKTLFNSIKTVQLIGQSDDAPGKHWQLTLIFGGRLELELELE